MNSNKQYGVFIIGLTGSIGMGKSTIANIFKHNNAIIIDADACAHKLMQKDGAAVTKIAEQFPNAISKNAIDRQKLSQYILKDKSALNTLEAILHPLIQQHRDTIIAQQKQIAQQNNKLIIIVNEIPLLIEKNLHKQCDLVILASAPSEIQKQRTLKRPNMNEEKLKLILKRQMPDKIKRKYANIIIDSSQPIKQTQLIIKQIIKDIKDGNITANKH